MLRRSRDRGLRLNCGDRLQCRQPTIAALERGVVEGLPEAVVRLIGHNDSAQPLHGCHAVPPANHRPQRRTVRCREVLPVHLVREDDFWFRGFFKRNATVEVNRPRRRGIGIDSALVCTDQDHFHATGFHLGPFQDRGKRHAGPLGIANSTSTPLQPTTLRHEKHPTVPSTLQRERHRDRGHFPDVVQAQFQLIFDVAFDGQFESLHIDLRHCEVAADEKLFTRRDPGFQFAERKL